jgi:LuxR family maltose regulon positive regulatory protein
VAAADELAQGSLEGAQRYVTLAGLGSASVPAGRRGQLQVLLGVVGLLLARQRGDLPAVAEEARRLQDVAEAPDAVRPGLGEELRALALINLGSPRLWRSLGHYDADAGSTSMGSRARTSTAPWATTTSIPT